MTSQITVRSWNRLLKGTAFRPGTRTSHGPLREYTRHHGYRSRIKQKECSHKWKTTAAADKTHVDCTASAFFLCNHNLSTFASSSVPVSSGTPCGKCDILGTSASDTFGSSLAQLEVFHSPSPDPQPQLLSSGDNEQQELEPTSSIWCHSSNPLYRTLAPSFPRSSSIYAHSALTRYQPLLAVAPLDTNWVVLRSFHCSHRCSEESKSKVEDAVKILKEELKEEVKSKQLAGENSQFSTGGDNAVTKESAKAVQKKPLRQRIIAEVKHYYHGFRLLFIDVKLCARYMWNVLMGRTLNRRERRQLVRTTADLFRLVPFLVFVIVPFMEFLLPVALKLFPGMLPSTFNEQKKEQEANRKKLKVKLEMAKFLQDTLEEMAVQTTGSDESRVHEFKEFLKRIRSTGEETTNEEIIKYSKLFKDEITLDSLGNRQLVALSKLVDLQTIGTNAFLRFQLRMKLRQLEADDRMIQKEGVDSLTVWELQEACRMRGMRALGLTTQRLQSQLQQWLDLHLNEQVPASLLLLSRTLYLPTNVAPSEQLKATISVLPETTAEEAKVTISEVAGERVDNKTKLEIIKQEEAAIIEERKQTEAEIKAKKQEEEAKAKADAEAAALEAAPAEAPATPTPEQVAVETGVKPEEVLVDKAEPLEPAGKEVVPEPLAAEKEVVTAEEVPISAKELEGVEVVLEAEAEKRESMKLEKEELEELKEDVAEYKENLEEMKVVVASGIKKATVQESKGAQRLSKQVAKLVNQMDKLMGSLHANKDQLTEEIEVREVRIRRSKELQEDSEMRQEVLNQISTKKANLIGINELLLSMRRLQKVSDETKLQRIMEVLDEDKDGKIDIDDALKVIDLLGQENVMVSASKMSEILDLLRREEQLEEEARQAKEAMKKADEDAINLDDILAQQPADGEKLTDTTVKTDAPQPPPEELFKDPADKKDQRQP